MSEHMQRLVRDMHSAIRLRAAAVAAATVAVVIVDLLMPGLHIVSRLIGTATALGGLFFRYL
jgi:hypothetical protein